MSRNWFSKKTAAAIVASVLALGALGAISPASAIINCTKATKDGNGCTVLSVKYFGDVIEPALVLDYQKVHPEIKLDYVSGKMDLDALNNTFLYNSCVANGKNDPDIAAIEVSYSGFWKTYPQCFTDLNSMHTSVGNKNAADIKDQYLPWRWGQGVASNNAVIGIPTDVGGLQVAYRWDLLKLAGLPYQRDAVSAQWSTWDKYIAFGKKYTAATKTPAFKKALAALAKSKNQETADFYKAQAPTGFIDNVATIYSAILNQGTKKYYENNGTPAGKTIYKTNKQVKLAFDTTVAASKDGIGVRVNQFSSDWNVGMTKGTFATMLSPAWMMDYIKGQAPDTNGKWDIANIPGGVGNQGGSQLTIPAGAKHKQEAWDFITWYLAPEQQLKVFTTYGLFPSTKTLYTSSELVGYGDPFFNGANVGKLYLKGILKLKPIFEGKKERCIDMAMGSALSLVINGKEKITKNAFDKGLKDADKCS